MERKLEHFVRQEALSKAEAVEEKKTLQENLQEKNRNVNRKPAR